MVRGEGVSPASGTQTGRYLTLPLFLHALRSSCGHFRLLPRPTYLFFPASYVRGELERNGRPVSHLHFWLPRKPFSGFFLLEFQPLWAKLETLAPGTKKQDSRGLLVTRNQRATGLICLIVFALATQGWALSRSTRYGHKHRRVRHIHWNPLFRGSHDMLVKQNQIIDQLELPRIADDDELEQVIENEELVQLKESRSLKIAANLTETRRYCKPWTRDFVEDFSQAFYDEFGKPIQVNSAVRTMQQQKKLRRRNRNAGPIDGDTASTHMAGITLDISKRGLTKKQHQWIEQYFLPLRNQGLIDPIEERRQPVFHVVVFDRYTEWRESQRVANTETDATD